MSEFDEIESLDETRHVEMDTWFPVFEPETTEINRDPVWRDITYSSTVILDPPDESKPPVSFVFEAEEMPLQGIFVEPFSGKVGYRVDPVDYKPEGEEKYEKFREKFVQDTPEQQDAIAEAAPLAFSVFDAVEGNEVLRTDEGTNDILTPEATEHLSRLRLQISAGSIIAEGQVDVSNDIPREDIVFRVLTFRPAGRGELRHVPDGGFDIRLPHDPPKLGSIQGRFVESQEPTT